MIEFDVEGMEFSVLLDLMVSGALCSTVDFVFGREEYKLYFNDSKWFQDTASKLIGALSVLQNHI